jgi:hypothetical protein
VDLRVGVRGRSLCGEAGEYMLSSIGRMEIYYLKNRIVIIYIELVHL